MARNIYTYLCLQADIESLEFERGELKDKMKQMSKKALIQGLSKSQMHNLSADGQQSLGPSVPSPVRDSPLLLQQVKDMRAAVNSLQTTQARIQGRDMRERLANLKPIKLPKKLVAENREKEDKGKESGGGELSDLMKRCNAARSDLFSLLSSQGQTFLFYLILTYMSCMYITQNLITQIQGFNNLL